MCLWGGHPTLATWSILPWSVGMVIPAWPSSPSPPQWLVESLLPALFTLSSSPQFSLLLRELFRRKKEHQVCTAQVTETCIFLLNTRLMINN